MKRVKGSGSIRPRGKGSWEIRYDAPPDAHGNVKRIYETVRGSRRDADRALRERLGTVESGDFITKSTETVAEFMKRWLAIYAETNTRPSTLRGYEGKTRQYIVPHLGAITLQNLQATHIQKMYAEMLKRGLSVQTVRLAHTILREALSHAVTWGVLNRNVADAATPPKPEEQELEMWDVPTIHVFLEAAKSSPYGDLYHLAILTGMRRAELVGLQWEYIHFDERWLSVASTLQRINGMGIVVGGPKSRRSRRTVALSRDAINLLKELKTRQLEQRLSVGPLWQDNGLVFTQANGKPLHPDKVTNQFTKIVRKNELPHLTLKGLRHAHATLLLAAGVHPKIVSERLGHSSIGITMDIYSHVMPGMDEEAARAIDEQLAQGGNG